MNYSPPNIYKNYMFGPLFENSNNHFHIDYAMHGWIHPLKSVSIHVQEIFHWMKF
jgi:hypothetical protein